MRHRSQLMVCHEKIAGDVRIHSSRQVRNEQWCQLEAHAWCFDCGYYVCEIHVPARHDRHRIQTVSDERSTE